MNLDKITKAQERIEELYKETDGKCYLSYSGGKDSTVILALIKQCVELGTLPEEGIPAVFCNTGIELGATIDFVKWCKESWYSNIEIIRPKTSFAKVLTDYGKPIKSKMKSELLCRYQKNKNENTVSFDYLMGHSKDGKSYAKTRLADKDMHILHPNFDIKISNECCHQLKKLPFADYNATHNINGYLLGERMAEGGVRELNAIARLKNGGKLCTKTKGKYIIKLPIIDWTDEDIEEYIKEYNVPLSKAYTEQGYTRTGCFLCPFSLHIAENLEKLWKYEPSRYQASMLWLKDVYIAQNVILPFDEAYEREREETWNSKYNMMRNEMLLKYRSNSKMAEAEYQTNIFEFEESEVEE